MKYYFDVLIPTTSGSRCASVANIVGRTRISKRTANRRLVALQQRMVKSALVRVRERRQVFGSLCKSSFEAIAARLAVLHEDVRIELHGIAEESIAPLDQLDVRYRRVYFLRKSLATLRGFAEAVRHRESCPEFRLATSEFTPEIERHWRKSVGIFQAE